MGLESDILVNDVKSHTSNQVKLCDLTKYQFLVTAGNYSPHR